MQLRRYSPVSAAGLGDDPKALACAGTSKEDTMKARIILSVTSALAFVGVVELCNAIEHVVGY